MDWDFLRGLPEDAHQAVLGRMVRRRYRRREIVFHEGDVGDRIFFVDQGRLLARVLTASGEEAALALHGVGDLIGELVLLDETDRRATTVVALEPSELLSLGVADLKELRLQFPEVDRALDQAVSVRLQEMMTLLQEARYLSADRRVLRRILSLEPHFDGGADLPIEIRITQEDLASMAGTTRPTANRALQRAERSGAISIARRRITITDHELLEKLAR